MKTRWLLLALLVMALLSACGSRKSVRHAQRSTATATEHAAPAAIAPAAEAPMLSAAAPSAPRASTQSTPTTALVTVNGRPITRARFLRALEAANGASILDQLITETLVDEELARRKLSVSSAQIETRLKRELDRIGLRGPQGSAFLRMPGTRERLRTQVTDMLKLGRLLFTDADLRRFHSQHRKDLFKNQPYEKTQDDVWQALFAEQYRQGKPQALLASLKRRAKFTFSDPRYAFIGQEYRQATAQRPPVPATRPMAPRIRPVTPPPSPIPSVPVPPPGGAPTPTPPVPPTPPPAPTPTPPPGNP